MSSILILELLILYRCSCTWCQPTAYFVPCMPCIFLLTLMCWTVPRVLFSLFQLLVCPLDYSCLWYLPCKDFSFHDGPSSSSSSSLGFSCLFIPLSRSSLRAVFLIFLFFARNGGSDTHYSFFSPFPYMAPTQFASASLNFDSIPSGTWYQVLFLGPPCLRFQVSWGIYYPIWYIL